MALKKLKFNLIEILISMVVIIFAMFIIISFLPLASQQQREAINQTHLANIAQDMMDYIKSLPQDAFKRIDTNNDGIDDTDAPVHTQYNLINGLATDKPFHSDPSNSSNNTKRTHFNTASNIQRNGSIVFYQHNTNDSVFLVRSLSDVNSTPNDISDDVKEAELEVRIWTNPSSFTFSNQRADSGSTPSLSTPANGQTQASINLNNVTDQGESINQLNSVDPESTNSSLRNRSVRVVMEFSWPLNKNYVDRKKEIIFFDQQIVTKN